MDFLVPIKATLLYIFLVLLDCCYFTKIVVLLLLTFFFPTYMHLLLTKASLHVSRRPASRTGGESASSEVFCIEEVPESTLHKSYKLGSNLDDIVPSEQKK